MYELQVPTGTEIGGDRAVSRRTSSTSTAHAVRHPGDAERRFLSYFS